MTNYILSTSKKVKYVLVCAIINLLSTSAIAKDTPSTTINNKPISINADNQQIDLNKNVITFSGKVVIIQDNLEIKANTVTIEEMNSKDQQMITADGSPVYFKQTGQNSAQQTISGHAKQLIYNVKRNSVTLLGNAELLQQDNHIVSDKIVYDVAERQILASASKGNKVKTVIIPNQVQEIKR